MTELKYIFLISRILNILTSFWQIGFELYLDREEHSFDFLNKDGEHIKDEAVARDFIVSQIEAQLIKYGFVIIYYCPDNALLQFEWPEPHELAAVKDYDDPETFDGITVYLMKD